MESGIDVVKSLTAVGFAPFTRDEILIGLTHRVSSIGWS